MGVNVEEKPIDKSIIVNIEGKVHGIFTISGNAPPDVLWQVKDHIKELEEIYKFLNKVGKYTRVVTL